jgi:dTDP-4-dehydrorhamnose reductase
MSKKSKLLILGGSGFLGSYLAKSQRLNSRFEITSTYFTKQSKNRDSIYLDCTDLDEVRNLLDSLEPRMIINSAALTNVDFCQANPEISMKINQIFPIGLANICSSRKIKLMQISTDHFSSAYSIPRSEETEMSPINYYGEHKLRAEKGIIDSGCEFIIVRTNFFGIDKKGQHFLSWILKSFENDQRFTGYTNVFFSPLSIKELVNGIDLLIYGNASGLFNLAANESISKYEFVKMVGEILKVDMSKLSPGIFVSDPIKCPRPIYMSLSNNRFTTYSNYHFPSIKSMLTQVLGEIPS